MKDSFQKIFLQLTVVCMLSSCTTTIDNNLKMMLGYKFVDSNDYGEIMSSKTIGDTTVYLFARKKDECKYEFYVDKNNVIIDYKVLNADACRVPVNWFGPW